ARDHDLVTMRQRREPREHRAELVETTAAAHVTRVDQDVAIGDVEIVRERVRVGDGHDPHTCMTARTNAPGQGAMGYRWGYEARSAARRARISLQSANTPGNSRVSSSVSTCHVASSNRAIRSQPS